MRQTSCRVSIPYSTIKIGNRGAACKGEMDVSIPYSTIKIKWSARYAVPSKVSIPYSTIKIQLVIIGM